jgi:hypothetical protein
MWGRGAGQGPVGMAQLHARPASCTVVGVPGHDVDDTQGRVSAVQDRARTQYHLHALHVGHGDPVAQGIGAEVVLVELLAVQQEEALALDRPVAVHRHPDHIVHIARHRDAGHQLQYVVQVAGTTGLDLPGGYDLDMSRRLPHLTPFHIGNGCDRLGSTLLLGCLQQGLGLAEQ